jgi:hypothetical protein
MIEFSLHFEGFYESRAIEMIENIVERDLEELNKTDRDFEGDWTDWIDYKQAKEVWVKEYLTAFQEHLKYEHDISINLVYKELWSPREYNFMTDKIIVEISEEDFNNIKDDKETDEWISEACKSRDGFYSNYPTLKYVKQNDEIYLQYIFKYIFEEVVDLQDIHYDMYNNDIEEELSNSGVYDNWYKIYDSEV